VNFTNSLLFLLIYIAANISVWILFEARYKCEYFLLTKDDTCGLVFSNIVIVVLFNCMRYVWYLISLTCFG
jgi:hypothetical protein